MRGESIAPTLCVPMPRQADIFVTEVLHELADLLSEGPWSVLDPPCSFMFDSAHSTNLAASARPVPLARPATLTTT